MQASRGVDLGILKGSVPVRLVNRLADDRTEYVRAPHSRNTEKAYISTIKCHQDGSGIVMSLASFMREKIS